MNEKAAALLAAGLVVAAAVVSFVPAWTLQGSIEKRLEKAEQHWTLQSSIEKRLEQTEKQQAQTAKQLEQLDKTLKLVQEKLLPLKDAPPGKWRLVHERKSEFRADGVLAIPWVIILEEIATGDLYEFGGAMNEMRKVSGKSIK